MKTEAIIFSKQRTLQLKSLLLSMKALSDVDFSNVHVLYVDSPDITYAPIMQEFPDCKFIRQGVFLEDVKRIVESAKSDYILFAVDDLIFRDAFSFADVERLLDSRPDIDSFCFRMGRHISGPLPKFMELGNGMLAWDTKRGIGKHWNYFWELSCSIYRKDLILDYLPKCRPEKERFPNPMEYHYYAHMPSTRSKGIVRLVNTFRFLFKRVPKRVACYERSKCMTLGINLVADLGVSRAESFSAIDLHKKMLEGYVTDFARLKDFDNSSPNAGPSEFKMIKPQ